MRAFLDLVEARGIGAVTTDLGPKLGPGVLDALRHAGILRPTGREPFEELSVPDLARALRALYGVESRGLSIPARLERQPAMLGWAPGPGGDRAVILVTDGHHGIHPMPTRSERTLVLVPTARHVTPELRARHGADAFMSLEVLEEVLVLRGGRLARAGARVPDAPVLELAPDEPAPRAPERAPATPPSDVRAFLATATGWGEVRVHVVHATALRIDVGSRSRRVTHVDVGMASTVNREPTRVWELLQAFCAGRGTFKSWRFGNAKATKKTVSRLRQELRALFGIDESPFFPYRTGEGWRSRFQAGERLPEDEVALSSGARAMLERAGKRG